MLESLLKVDNYLEQLEEIIKLKENNTSSDFQKELITIINPQNMIFENVYETEIYGKKFINPKNGNIIIKNIGETFILSFSAFIDNSNAGKTFLKSGKTEIIFDTNINSKETIKINFKGEVIPLFLCDNSIHNYKLVMINGILSCFRDDEYIGEIPFSPISDELEISNCDIYLYFENYAI